MEIKRFEFIVEAETPIAHHSGNEGNHSLFMRHKVVLPDGSIETVPHITGDALRNRLRAAAALATLDAAGILKEPNLSEGAIRLFFNGGMITGKGDGAVIKLDVYRKLCEMMPALKIFGGCSDNGCHEGCINVDQMELICEDMSSFVPDWVRDWMREKNVALFDATEYVEEVQRVRMDPLLRDGPQRFLGAGARKQLEARLESRAKAHETGDDKAADEAKSGMMPRTFERLIQGSKLYMRISAYCYTDLDADTVMATIGTFFLDPIVGGKRGTGHGRLRALAGKQIDILRPAENANAVDLAAPGQRVGQLFRAHVAERAADLRAYVESEVNA